MTDDPNVAPRPVSAPVAASTAETPFNRSHRAALEAGLAALAALDAAEAAGRAVVLAVGGEGSGLGAVLEELTRTTRGRAEALRIGGGPIELERLLGALESPEPAPAGVEVAVRLGALAQRLAALRAAGGAPRLVLLDARAGVSRGALRALDRLVREGALAAAIVGREALAAALASAEDARLRAMAATAVRLRPFRPEEIAALLQDLGAPADAAAVEAVLAETAGLAERLPAALAARRPAPAVAPVIAEPETAAPEISERELEAAIERLSARGPSLGLDRPGLRVAPIAAPPHAATAAIAARRARSADPTLMKIGAAAVLTAGMLAVASVALTVARHDAPRGFAEPAPIVSARAPEYPTADIAAAAEGASVIGRAAESALGLAERGARALSDVEGVGERFGAIADQAYENRRTLARARALEDASPEAIEAALGEALALASRRLDARQYTRPIGYSAYDALLEAHTLAPEDPRVASSLESLVEHYEREAAAALAQERYPEFYRANETIARIRARRPI